MMTLCFPTLRIWLELNYALVGAYKDSENALWIKQLNQDSQQNLNYKIKGDLDTYGMHDCACMSRGPPLAI